MKYIFIVMTSLLVFSVNASAQELPESFCSPLFYQCTQTQLTMLEKFRNQGVSAPLPPHEGVYAGSCYMVSDSYDADHEHYGYVYIKNEGPRYSFNSQLAFFHDENPYIDLNLEKARADYPEPSIYDIVKRSQDWLGIVDLKMPWLSFIRQVAPGNMIMISPRGNSMTVMCDLTLKEEQ